MIFSTGYNASEYKVPQHFQGSEQISVQQLSHFPERHSSAVLNPEPQACSDDFYQKVYTKHYARAITYSCLIINFSNFDKQSMANTCSMIEAFFGVLFHFLNNHFKNAYDQFSHNVTLPFQKRVEQSEKSYNIL